MNHLPHRWSLWPQGIIGRFVVIFAFAIALSLGVSELLEHDRHFDGEGVDLKAADRQRIVAIASFVQSREAQSDINLPVALNSPVLDLKKIEAPKAQQISKDLQPFKQALEQDLEEPFMLQLRRNKGQFRQEYKRGLTQLWPSTRRLVVMLRDRQGQWWQITMPQYRNGVHRGRGRQWVLLLLAGLIIWLGLSWVTRRMTRPILQFAAAADRLGMDVNASPMPEQGSSELKEAAQAFNRMQTRLQQLIADRTLMLAAISHDLRTILTRLRLRTELIGDETLQLKTQADLEQMEAMLSATVAYAKEESTPESYTPLDLRSLLQSVCDDLSDTGYQVTLDHGPSPLLTGQPTALRRAFANLIENAAIYGQVATISIEKTEPWIEVAIADRGPGIPDEMQEKVLQPFFRLDPSRNRDTGGTGLGLSVASRIIQRHHGTLKFQQLYVGTTQQGFEVRVQLPAMF